MNKTFFPQNCHQTKIYFLINIASSLKRFCLEYQICQTVQDDITWHFLFTDYQNVHKRLDWHLAYKNIEKGPIPLVVIFWVCTPFFLRSSRYFVQFFWGKTTYDTIVTVYYIYFYSLLLSLTVSLCLCHCISLFPHLSHSPDKFSLWKHSLIVNDGFKGKTGVRSFRQRV